MKNLEVKISISKDMTREFKPVETKFCELHRYINSSYNYSASFFQDDYRKKDSYLSGNQLIILDYDKEISL
ncbi:MAG: hypothetical protein ACOC1K_04970, partial [Nanoarchaeota archaeon]